MCGIFAFLQLIQKSSKNNSKYLKNIFDYSSNIIHRGPDDRKSEYFQKNVSDKYESNIILDFHRLSINDLSTSGAQPMELDNIYLMTNGEIYNHERIFYNITHKDSTYMKKVCELYNLEHSSLVEYNGKMKSSSDCEIILHMYKYFRNILHLDVKSVSEIIFSSLDGVFATIIYDNNSNVKENVLIGRDPIGVRPLFYNISTTQETSETQNYEISFCSEMKGLVKNDELTILQKNQFKPGSYIILDTNHLNNYLQEDNFKFNNYFTINTDNTNNAELIYNPLFSISSELIKDNNDYVSAMSVIRTLLEEATEKRLMSDRPIGCLLSGGLDSSLIASIVVKKMKERGVSPSSINTFSIGLKGSPDLKYAKQVADYLGTNHHEVIITIEEMINSVPTVVKTIESYDITSIRASVPNYLLAKYIKENTDVTVIFSGEGADEILGGYLYFHNAPSFESFQTETYRRVKNLYMYDVLRCDRTTSSQSLEVRVPFLDKTFLTYILHLDGHLKMSRKYIQTELENYENSKIEKHILRNAFDNNEYLPKSVLWRMKDAFSDAVGYNWVTKIKEYTNENYKLENYESELENENFVYNKPDTPEGLYYRILFNKNYDNMLDQKLIQEIWKPLWTEVTDPSATFLNSHQKDNV